MLWDDEYESVYTGIGHDIEGTGSMVDQVSEGRLDPMDVTDPSSAYFLLSDDAQDEIAGTDKKKMKCRACGYQFTGEIYDRCPKCDSLDTEEVLSFIDDGDEGGDVPSMRCLSSGHQGTPIMCSKLLNR
jgi:hypothetical protein